MRLQAFLVSTLGLVALGGLALSAHFPIDPGRSRLPPGPEEKGKQESTGLALATFAGGCFWCMEPPFDETEGVVSTTSGYTGGQLPNPTYEQVSSGGTGHLESIQIQYDPAKVSYSELLAVFWRNVDPIDAGGQFCDRGSQYETAIFYHTDEQRQFAEESKREIEHSGRLPKPIVTPIRPAGDFYPAEEYHQDYYKKNPLRYKFYRTGCGRDRVLRRLWGESGK